MVLAARRRLHPGSMNTRTRGLPLTASYYRFALAEPSQLTQAHVNGDVGAAPLGKEGKKGGFFPDHVLSLSVQLL